MVQTTVADIVSPTVAAHDPDALLHQVICQTVEAAQFAFLLVFEHGFQLFDALALSVDFCLAVLCGIAELVRQFPTDALSVFLHQLFGIGGELIHSQAHAHAKFSVILEQ